MSKKVQQAKTALKNLDKIESINRREQKLSEHRYNKAQEVYADLFAEACQDGLAGARFCASNRHSHLSSYSACRRCGARVEPPGYDGAPIFWQGIKIGIYDDGSY